MSFIYGLVSVWTLQCKKLCEEFKVRYSPKSRYAAGKGRCKTCDIWTDYRSGHLRGGEPASIDSYGWFCNCCNTRVRTNPRKRKGKERTREPGRKRI